MGHARLTIGRPGLVSGVFADLYLPEGAGHSRPLLVYFAGALNERQYEKRRRGEPSNVLDEFRFAVGQAGWGLLVVPPPPALTEIGPALRLEVAGLVDAFVEEAGWRPLTIATVGMSYGAMLGCALTLENPRCNRLATLAGVGMKEVVEAAAPDAVAGEAFGCFVNEGDPLSEQSHRFAGLMASAGRSVEVVSRKGEHSFADFVATAGLIQG